MDEAVEAALTEAGARINALVANERRLIDELAKVRKDAERYRWHKARNPSILLANAWGASKAACEIGDDPDAATDAAMADLPAVGAA